MDFTLPEQKSVHRRAQEGINVREELHRLDQMLEALKIQYEQFFLGLFPHPPDQLHNEVKRQLRLLARAPGKNSRMNYALRGLQSRYQTYNNYWVRTNREREAGTYTRDVFKANLREKNRREEKEAHTAKGQAKKSMQTLFHSYKRELEKQTGRKHDVDFDRFRKALMRRAKNLREQNGQSAKLSFRVVVKQGKVMVQAQSKGV